MRRGPLAALLRLLIVAGGAGCANPYTGAEEEVGERAELAQLWVEIPSAPVALGGDVRVAVRGARAAGGGLRARLAREDDDGRALLATLPLALDAGGRMTLPCGYFSRGGVYYLEIIADKEHFLTDDYGGNGTAGTRPGSQEAESGARRDVAGGVMETGESLIKSWKFDVLWPTAELDVTPEQIQTYPERPVTAILEFPKVVCAPLESSADFWLELLYCGHSSGGAVLCDGKNTSSNAHVLYSEQMHGFPGRRTMTLRCELFGQAGDYALTLRPAAAAGPQDLAAAFIKADWSEQFVLNVHGGSVFPCGEGVRVLFQYPECVLERADRVRVFGRDADRLRYVAERRVTRGQHTASFDCRLFSERYPEYCFVYVSQAVTGAVADVRMDCLPTLPLSEGGAGGWGAWSAWSACPAPAHCSTRTRSRHRFCDSPPPAYGAKYCEGQAVELAACECTAPPWAGDSSMVVAEVGARCRCGCVLHLAPTARLLAGSARACPARSFWLLQAEEGLVVRLRFEAVRLPCAGQALRARDGDSLGSPLLASWDGPDSTASTSDVETTTDGNGVVEVAGGRHILVELKSVDTSERCAGGFVAHAYQVEPIRNASAAWSAAAASGGGAGGAGGGAGGGGAGGAGGGAWWRGGGGARAAAGALAALAALCALSLALHSAHRTRAYQRAADKESLTDSDACSASLELGVTPAPSRSTLLSEVVGGGVSLRRLLPARARHTRLLDADRAADTADTVDITDTTPITDNTERNAHAAHGDEEERSADVEVEQETASVDSGRSDASRATVTPENASSSSAPAGGGGCAGPGGGCGARHLRRSHTVSASRVTAAHHHTGNDTDSQTSLNPRPPSSRAGAAGLDSSDTTVSDRGDSAEEKDKDSAWEKDRSASRASSAASAAATLTNGWYSPALSGVSAARIRDNPKHVKETCNRKLLKSDLSLTSHPEMEIDYYDYEVNNAGSVPGSYLGMDPAFLVWIPPIEDGDIIKEIDENLQLKFEDVVPRQLRPDPGSNSESPEERPARAPAARAIGSNESMKSLRRVVDGGNVIHPLNFSISDLHHTPRAARRNKRKKDEVPVSIAMKDLTLDVSPVRVHRREGGRPGRGDPATLKRAGGAGVAARGKDDTLKRSDLFELKYADENSDSSNEIRFADDSPDSNRLDRRELVA